MDKRQDGGDEIINFPVPKRYLPAVVQALAKAMEDDGARPAAHHDGGSTPPQAQNNGAATIDWTSVESFRNLRQRLRYPGVVTLLNLTAARPNEFISYQDVVRASKRADDQVRAELGALTKAIRRQYNVSRDEAKWPVEAHWAAGGEQQYYYLMRPEVARAWIESEK